MSEAHHHHVETEHSPKRAPRSWLRTMAARDPTENHRASTPLELLFDLCFVVAVAQAAGRLHHALGEGHLLHGVQSYGLVFVALWWAWMNFTWFASAYDTDDLPYRLKTLLQIAGVLVLAAGVNRAFDQHDFGLVTAGYAILRVGQVMHWLRAARDDREGRPTALRYALGLTVCQLGWLTLRCAPAAWFLPAWLVLMPLELLVPPWAERVGRTRWHPRHMAERYGLFTLIVLGESILASVGAIQAALTPGTPTLPLLALAAGGLLTLFAMWWIYFDHEAEKHLESTDLGAFVWGYGHLFVFASTAAVGAGLSVCVEVLRHRAHVSQLAANASFAAPVALYVLSVWALHVRPLRCGPATTAAYLGSVALVLGAAFTPFAVPLIGALLSLLVGLHVVLNARRAARARE